MPARAQVVRQGFYATNGSVITAVLSGNTLYIGGWFTRVGPATGGGLPIDGSSGSPISGFPKVAGTVQAVVADGSGGWYIGGRFSAVGGLPRSNLAHILSDETVSTWDPNADLEVNALAVSGTTVYVGGSFGNVGGEARNAIAALDATTGLATAWDPNALIGAARGIIAALAVSGTLVYAGGDFDNIGGQTRHSVAALDAGTGLATPWNPGADRPVAALVVSGNTIYAGGEFTFIGGFQPRNHVAALDATTGLATAWNPNASGRVLSLAVDGSTVYTGGEFTTIGGQSRNYLAALDANTGLATGWNPNPSLPVSELAIQGTTVYAGGRFTSIGGQARNYIAALDATTGLASAWDPNADHEVRAMAVSGTTIYAGGDFNCFGGPERIGVAALDVTTGIATPWNPKATGGFPSAVHAFALSGTTVFVGGCFTGIGGQARNNIAALDSATGLASAWDPDADRCVSTLAVSGDKVFAGGSFRSIGAQTRQFIAALDATTGLATPWNPNAFGDVDVLAVSGNTIYAAGSFFVIGGQNRTYLAALDATTGLATPWDPEPDPTGGFVPGGINAVLVNGNTVYVGGGFTTIGGKNRRNIAALDAATGAATDWDPIANDGVTALAKSGNVVYAGGEFSSIGGQARNNVAALDAASGLATVWAPKLGPRINSSLGLGYMVRALALGGSTAYVGGSFGSVGGQVQSGIAAMGDLSTPTLLSLVSSKASPGHVRLAWFASDRDLVATVYRRTVADGWNVLRQISADGTGQLVFDDTDVSPGMRYGYRLGVIERGRELFLGETWVDVPIDPEFALASPRPNPTAVGLTIAFSLPDASEAWLELLDIAGRRLIARESVGLGPGNHVVGLAKDRVLAPGIYLVRLTHGKLSRSTRVVVER